MLKTILSESVRKNDAESRVAAPAANAPLPAPEAPKKSHLFQPGNPGRPKGVKNKIAEDFLKDLHAAWSANGPAVIERVIKESPAKFLDIIARLVPKELTIRTETSDINDEQLGLFLDSARRAIENRAASSGGTGEAAGGKQTIELQALPKAE